MSTSTAYDQLRSAQIASVGGAFLRVRPLVTGLTALTNFAILSTADAPATLRVGLGSVMGLAILGFALEAAALRRRDPSERWLEVSLTLTVLGLGAGCVLSGAALSPVLPILFAPIAIALAAFGRTRAAATVLLSAGVVLLALVAANALALAPFGVVPATQRGWMTLVSAATSVALVTIGVSGLAEAYRTTGMALERTRARLVEESLAHTALVESTGLRIAHEIRTPLTSIKALVTLVASSPDGARTPQRLEVVQGEIARLEALVTDYLALARPLEAIARTPTALDEQLTELGAILEGRARERGVEVALDLTPVRLDCDPRRLREALLNLAANALDATEPGGRLTLALRGDAHEVRIEVSDTGRGLDAEALRALGRPFASGKAAGAGLGVVLARAVARQHGGELRFDSAEGVGTRAILTLPRELPTEAAR